MSVSCLLSQKADALRMIAISKKTTKKILPEEITRRHSKKVKNFISISDGQYLVFFLDDSTKLCNVADLIKPDSKMQLYLNAYPQNISKAKLLPDGFGIYWDDNMQILYNDLYNAGISDAIKYDDIMKFASDQVISSSEVCKLLNCSRQYVNELVKKEKLAPAKKDSKNPLFYKDDVLKVRWE